MLREKLPIRLSRRLGHLDDEVEERAVNFREAMRHALRNHDDVALGQMVRHTAGRGLAADFARSARRGLDHGSAGHKGRRTLRDEKNVRVLFVHLDVARSDPPAGRNLVAGIGQQRQSFGEGGVDLRVVEQHDVGRRRFGGRGQADKSKRKKGKQEGDFHGESKSGL